LLALIFIELWLLIGLISLCIWTVNKKLVVINYIGIIAASVFGPITNIIIWWIYIKDQNNKL
jgi:hypothetical protein